jgi:heptosyltransferase-2
VPDFVLKSPVVVRSPNWLGDAVMAFPAVRNLKLKLGSAPLTVAAPSHLVPVWELCPFVDRIVGLDKTKSWWQASQVLRGLQAKSIILLPNSFRAALEAAAGGLRQIVGYNKDFRRWFLSHPIEVGDYDHRRAHQKYYYLDLMTAIGAPGEATFPELKVELHRASAGALCLCPGAEYGPAKRWPVEKFVEVARELRKEQSRPILILGGPRDVETAMQVASQLPEAKNLAGQTTLTELIQELASAALVISNDSGSMHLASVLGTPTVAIFGSTEPRRTAPLGPRTLWLREHVPCSPCFLRECPLDFDCMKRVTAEMVVAAGRQLLAAGRA